MTNTGYKINPTLTQVFTTGPNSGSIVTSSFNVTYNTGSNFTSSFNCGVQYNYRVYDPITCHISGTCISPSITSISPNNCTNSGYDYIYNIVYNINSLVSSTSTTEVFYSLSPTFSGEVKTILIANLTDYSNSGSIDISDLSTLPLNQYTNVYFKLKNICGVSSSSSYSPIIYSRCPSSDNTIYYDILLCHTIVCCDNASSVLYKLDAEILSNATIIKKQDLSNAPSGNYNDGDIYRYWNGTAFLSNNNTCKRNP